MSKYKRSFERYNNELTKCKEFIVKDIARRLDKYNKPLLIGNSYYGVAIDPETQEPTFGYCNARDVDTNGTATFLPCWDRNATYEYGWIDFTNVVNLASVVSDKLDTFGI